MKSWTRFRPIRKGAVNASCEQRRQQYECEKDWAARLKMADASTRPELYVKAYSELYRRFPYLQPSHSRASMRRCRDRERLLVPYLPHGATYLEVGAGRGALAKALSRYCGKVLVVDVTEEAIELNDVPDNVEFRLIEGMRLPVEEASVDLAFSDQVMEHLHPDDGHAQLQLIFQSLKPGGTYICITPNRLNGPHDISKYFTNTSVGLHLKEYTTAELIRLFDETGFKHIFILVGLRRFLFHCPSFLVVGLERLLQAMPVSMATRLGRSLLGRAFLGVYIVGQK